MGLALRYGLLQRVFDAAVSKVCGDAKGII